MRGARFRGVWRDYQASVLETVDHCLADGRLHVVAAPGSGKTVLGLELVRKLGRPAIVLSPTVTIRSQWIERLCELFIEADAPCPDWTSTSLAAPGQLTVSTYQALHAGSDPGSSAGVTGWLEPLKALGPVTLVLDEAHHLRREWWRALQRLVEAIPDAVIVSLTATPPYDVPLAEWQRYESLCGPVDAEIAIPELVRNGDLCPHQDYVHLSTPTAAETRYLAERRAGLTALFEGLLDDSTFLDALASHPWLTDPPSHEEAILDDPETLSAMLIALAAEGWPLPRPALQLLGIEGDPTPPLSPYWFERLLDAVLVDQHDIFAALGPRLAELKAELQRLGAFEGGRVRIRETERLVRLMAGSAAKLESIIAIARSEGETLGDRLRMVVLADHVRIGDLPGPEDDRVAPAKLGVATIFDALRREGMADGAIGVVSGALVIVPDGALGALDEAAICCGVETYHIDCEPLPHGPGYSRISFGGESGHRIVAVMTRLFRDGHIRLLVGTQALLGEGWDAPSINTLVLASNVGSYMLSNQMRGRAIRTDPSDPAKVANIWHLATVEPEEPGTPVLRRFRWTDALPPSDPIGQPLGPDMELLKRRFRAFAGIAADGGNRIESGLARLDLGGRRWDAEAIAATNAEALHRAADRSAVAERWAASLGGVDRTHAMRQAARPTYAPRSLPFVDTLQYLAITGLAGGVLPAGNALRNAGGMGLGLGWLVMALAGLTLVYAAPKLLRAGYLLLRNGTLEASLGQVGRVLLETLDEAGLLSFPPEACSVIVDRTLRGERIVMLDGADRAGERLFLDAMTELLGPMGNPRYLLVRRSFLARRLRIDYHAVPAVLGQRKEWAEMFAKHWAKRVGRAELVFTRNAEGRRFLLVARTRSLAAGFRRDVDLLTAWH